MIKGVDFLIVMQVTSLTPGDHAVLLLYQSPAERVVHASIDGGPRCVCQQMAAVVRGHHLNLENIPPSHPPSHIIVGVKIKRSKGLMGLTAH